MEKKNLVVELKDVVSVSSASQEAENNWLKHFLQKAIESINHDQPESPAGQAVRFFLSVARQAGIWQDDKTPLSVRRALRKQGAPESASLTVLCRLEGRIRDYFRTTPSQRRSAGKDTLEGGAGKDTLEGGAGKDTLEGGAAPVDSIQDALRKGRLEGMIIMLRALTHYIRQCPEISKTQVLEEIRRAALSIKTQLDDAA